MAFNEAMDATPYSEPNYASSSVESSDVTTCTCSTVPDPSLCYDMTGNKILIIFNQYMYNKTRFYKRVPNRRAGTFADVRNLEKTFRARGFIVITHQDWAYKDIIKYLTDVCKKDHSNTSCIAVAMMTHGRGGEVCASDRRFPVRQLIEIVQTAPNLAEKPKLFFIQACRSGHTEPYQQKQADKELDIPVNADSIVFFAAYEDYVSFRNINVGSWLMQALCSVINSRHSTLHLLGMVPLINQLVSNPTVSLTFNEPTGYVTKECKQTPVVEFTLNKSSWMMQALCSVINSRHSTLHLLGMVPLINQLVANPAVSLTFHEPTGYVTKECKQTPVVEFTLNKYLML